jgi:uncharacterized protein YkwD
MPTTRRASNLRGLEALEPRLLLAITGEEQQFVYLLNYARHNPAAFQKEYGLAADFSQVPARPPLAVNDKLFASAGGHAEEMAQFNYFNHQSQVTGKWPNQMALDAGYALPDYFDANNNYIESIAAGTFYSQAIDPLKALLVDAGVPSLGHRNHLLGIDPFNADNREIGVGHAFSSTSTYSNYWAIHSTRHDPADEFLTGVVFKDQNLNGRYDIGEGLAEVTIAVGASSTQSNAAGGWSLPTVPGSAKVQASGGGFQGTAAAILGVGTENVEIDFISGRATGVVDFHYWQNSVNLYDVDGDKVPTPTDALMIINVLNDQGGHTLPNGPDSFGQRPAPFLDVDGDEFLTPTDAVMVINYLNSLPLQPEGGEGESSASAASMTQSEDVTALALLQMLDEESAAVSRSHESSALLAVAVT